MRRAILALYRVRGMIYYAAAAILIGHAIFNPLLTQSSHAQAAANLVSAAFVAALVAIVLTFTVPPYLPTRPARAVHPPVRGRWLALNSPASKVPSHGVRAYGQAYAIDLVFDPEEATRPGFGGAPMRAATSYPAFGEPVLAMIDGTVVAASGWRRDHRARSNAFAIAYLMIEAIVREIGGPGFVVGNHVTIRGEDGVYATVAHLQQASLTVAVGDRVTAGDQIGRCGNSGNSTEPHVHAQLMDRASLWTAQGVPIEFIGTDVPENGAHLEAR